MPATYAAAIGFLFSVVFIGIGLGKFSRGRDTSVSLTNVQLILWTGVVLGSYVGMAALKGGFLADLPVNLMALMGISAGSYVTAASTRAAQHGKAKRRAEAKGMKLSDESKDGIWGLVLSEGKGGKRAVDRHLSIPKLQVLFWTAVALLIYVLVVAGNFQTGTPTLPDPGSGLVVLMGISHGAYLGNKLSDDPYDE